jgi:spermidine synthase
MLPRKLIATAVIPDPVGPRGQNDELAPGEEIRLYQHGEEFSLFVGNWELMNSRASSSEEELARLACEKIATKASPRVLIGGLGMGFTLRATLDLVSADAEVIVAELVPEVVEWNRTLLAPLAKSPLEDPRVTVVIGDVAQVLRESRSSFDAIITDIDNGPHSKTGPSEGWLYSQVGLRTLAKAIRKPGVATIWAAGPAKFFGKNLQSAGFECEEIRSRAKAGKGARFVIWVAERK